MTVDRVPGTGTSSLWFVLVSDYALSAVLDWPGLTGGALPSYCCDVRGGKLQINVSQSLSDLVQCHPVSCTVAST